jgi:uncharacterized protein YceK
LNNKIAVLICVQLLTLVGCGTINTVFRDDSVASHNLKKAQTYCESIPRIYSGVAYNFCVLNGPSNIHGPLATGLVPLMFFDFVASGVFDTVVLPYTVYRQSTDGGIDID